MNFHLTNDFQKKAKKLCEKDPQLRKKLAKQFKLFQQNHRHKSLRLHKLQGKRSSQYSIWIQPNLRAICIKDKNNFVFFDLISHDGY